ncbi:hypothetical protein P2318_15450 [Myxococcaceae bacterium GXIMD 01537]
MSKQENHRYLAGSVLEAIGANRQRHSKAFALGLWVGVIAFFVLVYRTGVYQSPLFVPVASGALVLIALSGGLLLGRARRTRSRSAYLQSLGSPEPASLIQVIEDSASLTRGQPGMDALLAHSKAIAYALYGREQEATQALGTIPWASRAPMIQAVGLSAEGIVALLCRRDASHARELFQKARERSSVSAAIPGAAQTLRFHNTLVALSEVFLDLQPTAGMEVLEKSARNDQFPALQLLASFGLAAALERAGDPQRAAHLRGFIERTAAHCAPLHARPEEFKK